MTFRQLMLWAFMLFASISVIGCSDDDDPVEPIVPEDPRVETVMVSPRSSTFSNVGEEQQFEATAFDQEDAVIDTVFSWRSSDESVAFVEMDGSVVATGVGTAEISVSAGSASDAAAVTVTLDNAPLGEWIATGGGAWDDPANWSNGLVPGADDIAKIAVAGDYTVTLNGNVEVAGLIMGAGAGTQTLALNGNEFRTTNGGLHTGAELNVAGSFVLLGDFAWSGGTIVGGGLLEVISGAELHVVGTSLSLQVDVDNRGTITAGAGARLLVSETLDCKVGGIIDFQGNASVTVQTGGSLINAGTILKSLGTEDAYLTASSGEFSSTGSIRVEEGALLVRGGTLRGTIEIASDATLQQYGDTVLLGVNSKGDGPFVVSGTVELGTFASDIISFRHLILDSGMTNSITGAGSLLVDYRFVWRRGTIHGLNSFTTQVGSQSTLGSTGISILSATNWRITGTVDSDSNVDLKLANGAILVLENQGRWMQSLPGSISQGVGEPGEFLVIGEFHRTGTGGFKISTVLNCEGTLNLVNSSISVYGPFVLRRTGVITGGSTSGGSTIDAQLLVPNSPSVELRGTIRPDLDGDPAYITIHGVVDLHTDFVAEVDVSMSGDIDTETIFFTPGGQVLNGTVSVAVRDFPAEGAEFRVISTQSASGTMEVVYTGNNPISEVIQDARGVLLRR